MLLAAHALSLSPRLASDALLSWASQEGTTMAETITCPSGLTGRIRGMKAREERILADRKLARSGA